MSEGPVQQFGDNSLETFSSLLFKILGHWVSNFIGFLVPDTYDSCSGQN